MLSLPARRLADSSGARQPQPLAVTPTPRSCPARPRRAQRRGRQTSPAPGDYRGKSGASGPPPRAEMGEPVRCLEQAADSARGLPRERRRPEGAGPDRPLSGRTDSGRGGEGRAGGRRSRPGAGPAPPAVGAADSRGWAGGVQMRRRRRGARATEQQPSPGSGRRREPRRQASRNRFPSVSRLPAWDPRPSWFARSVLFLVRFPPFFPA